MKNTKANIASSVINTDAVNIEALQDMSESDILDMMLGEIVEDKDDEDEALAVGLAAHSEIEAAVAQIEKAEAVQELYVEAEKDAVVEAIAETDKPKTQDKPAKKGKKAAADPAEVKVPRVTHVGHKRSEVLASRLGGKASEFLLLEVEDADLAPEALAVKQAELLETLDARPGTGSASSTQKKVAEKIIQLFAYIYSGGTLNEVMRRAFVTLAKDGYLTSGDKGNLHATLLAKPYSLGTCRAQSGQIFAMFPMLKITIKGEKGHQVANPESLILIRVSDMLGIV